MIIILFWRLNGDENCWYIMSIEAADLLCFELMFTSELILTLNFFEDIQTDIHTDRQTDRHGQAQKLQLELNN